VKLFGLLCVLAYCAVATGVASRMLRLASRTGGLPELLIGAAMLTGGAIGYPTWVLFGVLGAQHADAALRLGFAGVLGLHLSGWANALAWYAIFRRDAPWARVVLGAVTGLLFLSLVDRLAAVAASAHAASAAPALHLYRLSLICQALPFLMMAVSSFGYHARLKRRLALGLSDAVVANRIWLWGTASAIVVVQYGWSAATLHLRHLPAVAAGSHVLIALLGLALAVVLSLAFFPPEWYLRRFDRTAPAAGGAAGA
jgi:hypothetical protein